MKPIHFALGAAAAAILGCTILVAAPRMTQAAPSATPEYVVIQWDGERKTQVIRPDGRVEFLATLMPGLAKPGDDVHQRGFIMTQLINKIAKEGYEYVGLASGEEIVMRKLR
jgi:hypothetical protein